MYENSSTNKTKPIKIIKLQENLIINHIFAYNSIVKYFREKNSNVYLCTLDILKAFDCLNHYSIFQCLIECGCPVKLVDIFCSWFRNIS